MEWPGWWSGDTAVDIAATTGPDAGWAVLAYLLVLAPAYLCFTHATFGHGSVRRSFWCPASRRDVEVRFETRGVPGFRRTVGVQRCSVFDPPTAVHCDRRCVERDFRLIGIAGQPLRDRLSG